MSETRDRIRRHVESHPGLHFNALVRRLDLAPGQVQYHLHRLTGEGHVVDDDLYGQTHYYPPGFDPGERQTLALARRETARDVLFYLLERDSVPASTVAEELGIARSTLSYHLDRLTDAGLVDERRDDRGRVHLSPARPDETLDLLETIRPSFPARLVDRFTRLVDDLLEA
jgi:predicted transcriptional regulator